MECIEIKVGKGIAEKWRKASPEKKAWIQNRIERELSNEDLEDSTEKPKPSKKNWKHLGSVALGGKVDTISIRDYAHND